MIQQEVAIAKNNPIPDNINELKSLVISLQKEQERFESFEKNYKLENQILREKITKLLQLLYGRKSEKYVLEDGSNQKSLFEIDETALPGKSEEECVVNGSDGMITVAEHKRKTGRKPLPSVLPRVEVLHDLSEAEKMCPCGCQMSRIGEETSEKLEMQPPQFWVMRHVRPKYACKNCEGLDSLESTVKLAASPVQILPKSIATPSLLAHVFVSKFADSLPFYRQEKQFLRNGIELGRGTMCNWAVKIAEKLEVMFELLGHAQRSGPALSMDETPIQVLNEPGRLASSKSYMWVVLGSVSSPTGSGMSETKGVVIFHYSPSRSGEVASRLIGDYRGYIQTDGYAAYDFLDGMDGVTHVGCWGHVRRKFVEVARLYNKSSGANKGIGKCGHALQTINKLYMIERKARTSNLSSEELYQLRQDESKPILLEFHDWLKENKDLIPPSSLLGEAFHYTLRQWPRLVNYLKSGIVRIDNNLTENAIRPFVVGRKNWLFADQPEGAHASAIFYSFIETAKVNGLEPYSYFLYLFDRLPNAVTEEDHKKLLPINVSAEILAESKKEYWMKLDKKS